MSTVPGPGIFDDTGDDDGDLAATYAGVDDFAAAMVELHGSIDRILDEHTDRLGSLIQQICAQAAVAVTGAEMASVTLVQDGQASTAAATTQLVYDVDQDQYRSGDGPCLEAARTKAIVATNVDDAADQWPGFAASARRGGLGSYLSAPLYVDEIHTGAINLYATSKHGFRDLDTGLLLLFTRSVELALHVTARYQRARQLTEQLQTALTSRATIDQAKGILIRDHKVGPDQAFNLLSVQSQNRNIKLAQLARRIVDDAQRDSPRDLTSPAVSNAK